MADVANDLTTTASVDQGDVYQGEIETSGDQDWIAVTLTAGITYGFSHQGEPTNSGTLVDPYIRGLYDSEGTSLGLEDDDSGTGRESLLVFTPDSSGTYYVSVGGWNTETGTYSFTYDTFDSISSTPYSDPAAEQFEATGVEPVDALLSLWRYKSLTGEETIPITYSVPTTGSVWSDDPDFGYGPDSPEPRTNIEYLDANEVAIFEDALAQIASFANVQFTEVADNAESAGTIRIAWTGIEDEDSSAWAYLPFSSANAGDIWLLTEGLNTGGEGSFFQNVVLHELGHAVGLKHPFDTDGTGVVMPAEYDGLEYTLMAYNTSVDGEHILGSDYYPTTYMYYDILALQATYGAIETAPGNTTYSFESGERYYITVWDTGGTDTYDASEQTANLHLDLTPGSWSNVGTVVELYSQSQTFDKTDTVFTPPEITIEQAFGGSGNDTLTGNDADNVLGGNGGNDQIDGGAGADLLRGNAGQDTVSGGAGNDTIWAGAGDTSGDEFSGGTGDDIIGGGSGDDLAYGGNGSDILYGGDGDDTLSGAGWSNGQAVNADTGSNEIWSGDGNDQLHGGSLADALGGGEGDDTIIGYGGGDVIYAGSTGDDELSGEGGDDLIFGGTENDTVSGGAGSDELYGGSGNDNISGGSDADTIYGGGGDDTLRGGAGDDIIRPGDGNDLILFVEGSGDDVVEGFVVADDRLDLSETVTDFTSNSAVQAAATDTNDGVVIDLGGGNSVLLSGFTVDDIAGISILFT